MLRRLTWSDGYSITTELTTEEAVKRMDRLDWLRVITEGFEEGEGYNICRKALRAYNKKDHFTGIIRLTFTEKDFLGYMLENNDDERDIEVINYYIGGTK